jgi:hypothetical protein
VSDPFLLPASSDGLSVSWIKSLTPSRHRNEDVGWSKTGRESRSEIFECINNLRHSLSIDPTEGPAAKWRKPDTKHSANVAVTSHSDNSLFECFCRLVHQAASSPCFFVCEEWDG